MSRRRARSNELTVIYWRDIPAQVTANAGGRSHKQLLEPRFQVAIDRAATVAGLTETAAYVSQWRRESHPLDDESAGDRVAADTARRISGEYDRDRLEALVATGGVDDKSETNSQSG